MKTLLLTLVLTHGVNAVTTVHMLHYGVREANPFLPQNPVANVVVSSAGETLAVVAAAKLSEHHPTLARTLTSIGIGVNGVAIGFDLHAVHHARH